MLSLIRALRYTPSIFGFQIMVSILGVSVSKVARALLIGLQVPLVAVAMVSAEGQARSPHFSAVPDRIAQAADTIVRQGFDARLPPHVSTLLGISDEQESPVKQGVVRTGTVVQGLDVSVLNKDDIVLFVVNEGANDQSLYLTSPLGKLRKVVQVKAGVGTVVPITDEEQNAFRKEKQFWIDRLVPAGASK